MESTCPTSAPQLRACLGARAKPDTRVPKKCRELWRAVDACMTLRAEQVEELENRLKLRDAALAQMHADRAAAATAVPKAEESAPVS